MSSSSDTTSATSSSTSVSTSSPTNSPTPSTSSPTNSSTLTPTETPTISNPSTSSSVSPSTSLTSQSSLSTTSPPPVTSPSTSVSVSTSNGGLVTVTSVVAVTPTRNIPSATSAASAPATKGFFQNKGAVAGVFTVVGLVALAIVIALITNTIRRRRAQKFDREIAEAAAEAAAVPAPTFDDDDHYGPTSGGGYGGYGGQYSDVSSHGTYAQPPVSVSSHGETYNMRELGPGPSPGEIYNPHDPYAAFAAGGAAGAAGIGVARARSTREPGGYAAALQDGGNPYAAFVAPPPLQHQPQSDTLDNDSTGLQRGISLQHQQQQNYSDLSRNTSQGARSGDSYYPASSASPQSAESYPPQYQSAAPSIAGLAPYAYPPNQGNVSRSTSGGPAHYSTPQRDDAAYGAIGAAAMQPSPIRTVREDYGDESSGEEDEGPGKRVLKVANE